MKEIRNEFEQELTDNGYKIFKSNYKEAIRGFQKKITDKKGIKYFINIWHYNHSEQLYRDDIPKKDTYTSDSQFRFDKTSKDATCNVEFWGEVMPNEYREIVTLKNIEDFFENFFKKMKPDYYDLYN